jgi:hypothetical protein
MAKIIRVPTGSEHWFTLTRLELTFCTAVDEEVELRFVTEVEEEPTLSFTTDVLPAGTATGTS